VPGYQSFAKYHKNLDAVFIEFYSTTDRKLHNWNLSQIINKRIVKILKNKEKIREELKIRVKHPKNK